VKYDLLWRKQNNEDRLVYIYVSTKDMHSLVFGELELSALKERRKELRLRKFEDTKDVIRSYQPKKYRQCNGQKNKTLFVVLLKYLFCL
jgi:hypothetical protein